MVDEKRENEFPQAAHPEFDSCANESECNKGIAHFVLFFLSRHGTVYKKKKMGSQHSSSVIELFLCSLSTMTKNMWQKTILKTN